MIRITTYYLKPDFVNILMQALAGMTATITMRHDPDNLLKYVHSGESDVIFINDGKDGMDLLNAIRQSDPIIPVVFICNKFELYRSEPFTTESGNIVFINYDVSSTYLQTIIKACFSTGRQLEIRFKNSVFNYTNRELVFEDRKELMSKKEADILRTFYLNRNNIVYTDEIVRHVWGKSDLSTRNSFSVYLCNLKKILRQEKSINLTTVRGRGYIFNVDHE